MVWAMEGLNQDLGTVVHSQVVVVEAFGPGMVSRNTLSSTHSRTVE